jgi:hypothetical protein
MDERVCVKRSIKMDTLFEIELDLYKAQREGTFPMQEQGIGPVTCRTERPAAVIFAECLAENGSGFAASVFIP